MHSGKSATKGDPAKRRSAGWMAFRRFVGAWVWFLAICAPAPSAADDGPFLLVLIDRLHPADLAAMPELRGLAAIGGAGLMNVRTAGGGPAAGYLSLGAGGRASAPEQAAGLAFNREDVFGDRPVDHWIERLEIGAGEVAHLGFRVIQESAAGERYTVRPGLVGGRIRASGRQTAVFGNADAAGSFRRYGVLTAMDEEGAVERGDVGGRLLTDDPQWPIGPRTDYGATVEAAQAALADGGLVVVEFGDLARLEDGGWLLGEERAAALRLEALARMDGAIAQLWSAAPPGARLWVAAPSPSRRAENGGILLTPVVTAPRLGGEGAAGGLLTSATTRRPGLIANSDLGPTIWEHFGLETDGSSGEPVRTAAGRGGLDRLLAMYDEIVRVHAQRLPLIRPYFYVHVLAVLLAAGLLAGFSMGRLRWNENWEKGLRLLLLSLSAFPLALLLLPLLPPRTGMGGLWLQAAGAVVLVVAASAYRAPGASAFTRLALLTAGAVALDMWTGASLMSRSHLGYDPVAGSRYYGIGNEYMGLLVGAAAVAGGGLLDEGGGRLRPWVAAGFAAVVLGMASPRHGINVGGAITGVLGLGATWLLFRHSRLELRRFWPLALAAPLVLGLAAWWDLAGENVSHLGRALEWGSGDPLWLVFERKVSVNLRLLRLTFWSRAFLVSLLVAAVLLFHPFRLVRKLLTRHRYTGLAVRGALLASLVALATNDSGVVAAATLLIPVVTVLLYLMLRLAGEEGTGA